jgi:zinc transporter 5/7
MRRYLLRPRKNSHDMPRQSWTDIRYRSWLQLPEALTAFLIPLPYLFAALAYPSSIQPSPKPPSSLSEAIAESMPATESANATTGAPLLHALTLSSATLLLVGVAAKVNSTLQPLDRRKEAQTAPKSSSAPKRIISNTFSVFLPFYASLQLSGSKTALVLLIAVAAGIGALDQKPGNHTPWDDVRRALRTRKTTCGSLCLAMLADIVLSENRSNLLVGYAALLVSIFLTPPPLPTAAWSLMTNSQNQNSFTTQRPLRASLPKPSSPLINTAENQLFTLVAGLVLLITAVLYSFVSPSATFSLSQQAVGFSVLSIASTTALVYFSLPASLRSPKQTGLKLSGILVFAFSFLEHDDRLNLAFPFACAVLIAAVSFDTRSPVSHSHDHTHAHEHGHKHDHHLHGNHSRISAFLIARSTPGSIIHSVLIERDSRRIAYFGV